MKNDMPCGVPLKKIKTTIPSSGAVFITSGPDIEYFSRFYLHGQMLLIPKKGQPVCFIDSMNKTLVEKKLEGRGIRVISGNGTVLDLLVGHVKKAGIRTLYFDPGKTSHKFYRLITSRLDGISLRSDIGGVPLRDHFDMLRKIKRPDEIKILRQVARSTSDIWRYVEGRIKPGMKEVEIASMIDGTIRDAGYVNSFPTIAAAGKNTSYPHAVPGEKKLGKRQHLVLDFGIRHKLYCSDLTRIWGECRINRHIGFICERVRAIQKTAIDLTGPGVAVKKVAGHVDLLFREKDLIKHVLHGLGHGIGIEVHERPALSLHSEEIFKEGMVFTVEPGLYVTGVGGARIEDMVLVTSKGREVLTV